MGMKMAHTFAGLDEAVLEKKRLEAETEQMQRDLKTHKVKKNK
jgi:hypothetical protein